MEAPLNKICNKRVGFRLRTAEDTDTPGTRTYDALTALLVVAADPQVINKVAQYFDEVPVAWKRNTSCGAQLAGCPYRLGFRA
jgi:hypothetical protein